jgi:hypothetical protein
MTDQSLSLPDNGAGASGEIAAHLLPKPTRADRLAALEAEFNASFERKIRPRDGAVILRLIFKDSEDAVSGVGKTTEEALAALEIKLGAYRASLTEG